MDYSLLLMKPGPLEKPDPESLQNDPIERAKFLKYKETLASRAAPYSYSAVDAGKEIS